MLNYAAIEQAPLANEPFDFFQANGTLSDVDLAAIRKDFPHIDKPGIYPLSSLTYGPGFAKLIDEVQSPALRKVIEKKFNVDLANLPMMITVRGRAQQKDGRIHADSKDKIITCLLYLNDTWEKGGGRLRMLRSPSNMNDYAAEISPNGGTFAAFRVTPHSWHGHEPFVGERRYIMFNWVRSEDALKQNLWRHRLSAVAKKIFPFFYKGY